MKSNLDKFFKVDEEISKTGVWLNIDDEGEVGFHIKHMNPQNQSVRAAHARHFKPYAHQIANETLSPDKELELSVKFFVSACLLDWKGIEIDGKPAPFDKAVAVEFLMGLPDLFRTLEKHATDFKNFKEDPAAVDELGNSSPAI